MQEQAKQRTISGMPGEITFLAFQHVNIVNVTSKFTRATITRRKKGNPLHFLSLEPLALSVLP